PLLFSIAYRMLGDVAEAEDVVQDVYLKVAGARDVRDPKAFLVTAATRLSIDRLRSARRRRETYVGPWLPEPLLGTTPDASEVAERAETLSLAFLVLLESLTPVERAAFLLRDAFGFSYAEVASALDRTEVSTRQLVHRARRSLATQRRRAPVPPDEHRRLLDAFVAACSGEDVDRLTALLAEDAIAYTDGGGEAPAARRPIEGRARVARFLAGVAKKAPAGAVAEIVAVNGRAGLFLRTSDGPVAVVDVETAGGLVQAVYVVAAPSKLRAARSERV
ncbi:MAG TPA: RNA polymerase sigma-70 factor, partial [Actinomycetota bacterium]|nr:RNA polymerase sigma-70 factor [Actinomycetota bacterium]